MKGLNLDGCLVVFIIFNNVKNSCEWGEGGRRENVHVRPFSFNVFMLSKKGFFCKTLSLLLTL